MLVLGELAELEPDAELEPEPELELEPAPEPDPDDPDPFAPANAAYALKLYVFGFPSNVNSPGANCTTVAPFRVISILIVSPADSGKLNCVNPCCTFTVFDCDFVDTVTLAGDDASTTPKSASSATSAFVGFATLSAVAVASFVCGRANK